MKKGYQHYYSLLRFLRKNVDFPYPIRVKRCKVPKDRNGDCTFRNKEYIVRIDSDASQLLAIETLIHELSHALSWHTDDHHTEHGPKWGLAYSRIYRKYLIWLGEDGI